MSDAKVSQISIITPGGNVTNVCGEPIIYDPSSDPRNVKGVVASLHRPGIHIQDDKVKGVRGVCLRGVCVRGVSAVCVRGVCEGCV